MRKRIAFLACVVAGFLIVGAFFCQLLNPVSPAVAAIPTPVGDQAGGGDWVMTTYTSASAWNGFTTTQTSPSQHSPAYTAADISWTVAMSGTAVPGLSMALTCTLQFSNDNTSWGSGVNIFGNAQANVTNVDQFELFGRYHRIQCTENITNNQKVITATIMGKLMN